VTRKMRVQRILNSLNLNKEEQKNDICSGCSSKDFVWDNTAGDIICTNCGIVLDSAIQTSDSTDHDVSTSGSSGSIVNQTGSPKSIFDPIYVRVFHFNEVLATLTLTGPWINNADFREIRRALKYIGIEEPSRGDIQNVLRALNAFYGCTRFTKKYSEKWIQIVYRYCGSRPPELHPNFVRNLQRDFVQMASLQWSKIERFLQNSKRNKNRVQWPNYLETLYNLIERRYPDMLPGLKPWISRLSAEKIEELKKFFEGCFRLLNF